MKADALLPVAVRDGLGVDACDSDDLPLQDFSEGGAPHRSRHDPITVRMS